MKHNNSTTFLNTIKNSYFNSMLNEREGVFKKSNEKMSTLEFELERNKDIIIKLRADLASKNKEISLLKVHKNRTQAEYQKSMRVIEEILKQCDQMTIAGFNTIEKSINENNNNNNQLPQIGEMLHFNEQQKKIMKEMVYVNILKQQINSLNENLSKKEKEIIEIKKNKN